MVMGEDSRSIVRFESQHLIMGDHIFTLICCIIVYLKRPKTYEKEARDGPFLDRLENGQTNLFISNCICNFLYKHNSISTLPTYLFKQSYQLLFTYCRSQIKRLLLQHCSFTSCRAESIISIQFA